MKLDDYGLREYEKSAGAEKKIKKPVFENVNRTLEKIDRENKMRQEMENLEQAKLAAASGTWFEKKKSATSEDVKEAAKNLTNGGLIKVPAAANENESIYRRVAKFLIIVGIDEAAKIIPHLTDEQTEKIIPEIASIRKIEPEESAAILEEFNTLFEQAKEEGGIETARTILTKAYGSVKAEDLLQKSVTQFSHGKPFEYLSDANAERIKILIESESDSVKAIVISQIEPQKAAQIINLLDEKSKSAVILRLAKMKKIAPEVLANIDKSLHEKLLTQNTENSKKIDGRNVLAQILKRMTPGKENEIVATLSEQDPELGADLRKRLFTEEDIVSCTGKFLPNFLHDMEDRDIAVLIHGKSEPFREKILSNVSRNRRKIILDEEEFSADTISKADSERITSAVFATLRRAWEKGDLIVYNRDEIYV